MNILFFVSDFPYPEKNGFRYSIMETLRLLHGAGHEITVLAVTDIKSPINIHELPENYRTLADFVCVEIQKDLDVIRSYSNFFFHRHTLEIERYASVAVKTELVKLLKAKKFDIVQLEDVILSQYVHTIRENSEAEVILSVHQFRFSSLQKKLQKAGNTFTKGIAQEALLRWEKYEWAQFTQGIFDTILTVHPDITQQILSKITEAIGQKAGYYTSVQSARIGWDSAILPEVNTEITRNPHSVVYFGSLSYAPNKAAFISFMTNVWLKLKGQYPDAKLYVAASSKPQEFNSNWGETEGVVWEGKLNNLYEFIQDKAIMVVPMLDYDGFQQRIWEGMAMGCALVASPAALCGIPARHGDNIFIAPNEEKFRLHLGTLLEHPNIAATIGKHAQVFARTQLTIEQAVESLEGVYGGF